MQNGFTQAMRLSPRSREGILKLYCACARKLGRPPGQTRFCKMAGITRSDFFRYWPRISELSREACGAQNQFRSGLPEADLFAAYARLCLHLKKIPTRNELRIASRELGTPTSGVFNRFGTAEEFDRRFRDWLLQSGNEGSEDLRAILSFQGWERVGGPKPFQPSPDIISFPFLPSCLQFLDILSHAELPPYGASDEPVSLQFERKCGDAFRALGFEIAPAGQGQRRTPGLTAVARPSNYGIILVTAARSQGFTLGADHRPLQELVARRALQLERDGVQKSYLAIVSSEFREGDLKKLGESLAGSRLRGITFFVATALMRIVSDSIRDRSQFNLGEFEKMLFGNKIVR